MSGGTDPRPSKEWHNDIDNVPIPVEMKAIHWIDLLQLIHEVTHTNAPELMHLRNAAQFAWKNLSDAMIEGADKHLALKRLFE